jgi:hypothetical protein
MANIGIKPRKEEIQIIDITTRCHDWLAKELNIKSNLEFGRTAYWGRDAFHAGLWYNNTKQSVLNFRNLYGAPMNRLLTIIGHEARHAVQYRDGMMRDTHRSTKTTHDGRYETGYWNGKYYSGPYLEAPWEIDARAHEKIYSQMIIDSGIITDSELKLILPGSQDQRVYLEQETRNRIVKQYGSVSWYKAACQSKKEYDKAQEQFETIVKDCGFVLEGKTWNYKGKNAKQAQKTWNDAKELVKTKYKKNTVAFLTSKEEAKIPKSERFWEAQKNQVEYDSRPLQDSDLVF